MNLLFFIDKDKIFFYISSKHFRIYLTKLMGHLKLKTTFYIHTVDEFA